MIEIKTYATEFCLEDGGEVIGKIQFTPSGEYSIRVTHTEIDNRYGGQGLGKRLVQKVAEYAKQENKTIIAECSYAKKVLERDEKFKSLLVD